MVRPSLGRKVERLTVDHLGEVPGSCAACVFWELDPVRRQAVRGHEAAEKAAWLSMVLREWGSCGAVVRVEDSVVGLAIWAPPAHVPGASGFATSPVSPDAVLLTTLWVAPELRGSGVGRLLIQTMAGELVRRGDVRAVEAFGDDRDHLMPGGGQCIPPAGFLRAVGFGTQRAHPVHPRMRMDLRTTLSIREELEGAMERLLGAVRRPSRPKPVAPTGRTGRDATH